MAPAFIYSSRGTRLSGNNRSPDGTYSAATASLCPRNWLGYRRPLAFWPSRGDTCLGSGNFTYQSNSNGLARTAKVTSIGTARRGYRGPENDGRDAHAS